MKTLKNDHSSDRVTACNNARYHRTLSPNQGSCESPVRFHGIFCSDARRRVYAAARTLMEVVNNLTGKSAIVLVPDTGEPRRTETAGRRTFNRYGERFFFAGVWTPDGARGHGEKERHH